MQRTGISHLIFSCFVALALLIPTRSFDWGKDGHAAIVRLAFQLMPAAQRERLYAILDTTDPYYIGNWAGAWIPASAGMTIQTSCAWTRFTRTTLKFEIS